jgi:hypothetical protein
MYRGSVIGNRCGVTVTTFLGAVAVQPAKSGINSNDSFKTARVTLN